MKIRRHTHTLFRDGESHPSHPVERSSPSSDRRQKDNGDLYLLHYNDIFWHSVVMFLGTHDWLIEPTSDGSKLPGFPCSGDLMHFIGL